MTYTREYLNELSYDEQQEIFLEKFATEKERKWLDFVDNNEDDEILKKAQTFTRSELAEFASYAPFIKGLIHEIVDIILHRDRAGKIDRLLA